MCLNVGGSPIKLMSCHNVDKKIVAIFSRVPGD